MCLRGILTILSLTFGVRAQFGQGQFLGFPDGKAPDGSTYNTAYRCEGEDLKVTCPKPGQTIDVIRANFGRFSIAICNRHGATDWSVNCVAYQTTEILQRRCNGKSTCEMPVNSHIFDGDPCPGTRKYVEVHYACVDPNAQDQEVTKPIPNWLYQNGAIDLWNEDENHEEKQIEPRKPILVPIQSTTKAPIRIPITTPKSVTTIGPATTRTSTTEIEVEETTLRPEQVVNVNTFVDNKDKAETILISGPSCSPTISRKLHWNRTKSGETAIQPCPVGSSGLAKWACQPEKENPDLHSATWAGFQPDLGDCKSQSLSDLEIRVRQEDPETVVVSKLVQLTDPTQPDLVGGDIEAALGILNDVANRLQYKLRSQPHMYNKESHVLQILKNVLLCVDNLLSQREIWEDLGQGQRSKLVGEVMRIMEVHAFVLAEVMQTVGEVREETKQIVLTISVVDLSTTSKSAFRFAGRSNDSITIERSDLQQWKSKENLVKLVFVSYENLHQILHARFSSDHRINSRVLSLSVDGNRLLPDKANLKIELSHLRSQTYSSTICAQFDSGFDSESCSLVSNSDSYRTVCQCSSLKGGFLALAKDEKSSPIFANEDAGNGGSFSVQLIAYIVVTVCLLVILMVLIQFRQSLRSAFSKSGCCSSCCFCRARKDRPDTNEQKMRLNMDTILGQARRPPHHLVSHVDPTNNHQFITSNNHQFIINNQFANLADYSSRDPSLSTLPRTTLTQLPYDHTRPRPSQWPRPSDPHQLPPSVRATPRITPNPLATTQALPVDNYPVASGTTNLRLNSEHENLYWEIGENTGDGLRRSNNSISSKERNMEYTPLARLRMGEYVQLPMVGSPRRDFGTLSTNAGDSPRRNIDCNTLSTTLGDSPRRFVNTDSPRRKAVNPNLRKKAFHVVDSEDDTVHNLTDFSEDEDQVVETTNSDVSGQSSSSSRSHKNQAKIVNRKKYDVAKFDFGGKVTNI